MNRPKKANQKDLEDKVVELTEALQRERADAINIRRRHNDQITNLRDVVKGTVVKDLLPVIDNFERALAHTPKEIEKTDYAKGISGIVKQFEKTLQDIGVKKIRTIGERFDPNLHEAVSVEGKGSKEIISEELQPGYTLGDQVLRHAIVKVKQK